MFINTDNGQMITMAPVTAPARRILISSLRRYNAIAVMVAQQAKANNKPQRCVYDNATAKNIAAAICHQVTLSVWLRRHIIKVIASIIRETKNSNAYDRASWP
jgi:hypothetical protein